jgi:hypothetical protein
VLLAAAAATCGCGCCWEVLLGVSELRAAADCAYLWQQPTVAGGVDAATAALRGDGGFDVKLGLEEAMNGKVLLHVCRQHQFYHQSTQQLLQQKPAETMLVKKLGQQNEALLGPMLIPDGASYLHGKPMVGGALPSGIICTPFVCG